MIPLSGVRHWLCDMDGVLILNGQPVPGAKQFLNCLRERQHSFLIVTNNSLFTPRQLKHQLGEMGLEIDENQLWTSALATAHYVQRELPRGTAYVIGQVSMHEALERVGYRESVVRPDFVILAETRDYSFDDFTRAIRLIEKGSRFIATNPEPTGPSPGGPLPGCGAMAALIERATGHSAYFVGKPNPVMILEGLTQLGAHPDDTVLIGDRMETDILAGVRAGLDTILVLSGFASRGDVANFPFQPTQILDSVAHIVDRL